MAKDETKRIKLAVLLADRELVLALGGIDGYAPGDASMTQAALQAALADMNTKQIVEVLKNNEADAAGDTATAAEWALHNLALRVKEKVIGQFGSNSDEAASVGLKKKSEYKSPTRKTAPEVKK